LRATSTQSTGPLQARGSIPNKDYFFLPGQFVRVRVPVGTIENALLVTDRALGVDQQGHYALVVNQADVVEQRPVQIGALIDGMRVIEQGVSADDWVVVEGIQRAIPGSRIAPERLEQAPVAPAPSPETAAGTDGTPAPAPAAAQPAAER
jgi:multidrug efflux pump subunit AcrA (membrane-fusion protein)